jgi:hypothetical protein
MLHLTLIILRLLLLLCNILSWNIAPVMQPIVISNDVMVLNFVKQTRSYNLSFMNANILDSFLELLIKKKKR